MSTTNAASAASSIRTLEDFQKQNRTGGKSLGQEDFLKILVAQMAHQDPLEPTSNGDFLAQMAQFTMLEQIKGMSESFSTSQAYSMIGKYVFVETDKGLILGKVDGVVSEKGKNYLMIGGEAFDASKVAGVMDSSVYESGLDKEILQSANLIGCTVTATVKAEDGTESTITGEVSRIMIQDGAIYAVVDGQNIPVSSITEIA